jgi:hypothetical protein
MGYFKLSVVEEGDFVIIQGFHISTFFRDLRNTFKTSKLINLHLI